MGLYLRSENLKFRRTFSKKLLVIAPVITVLLAWLMGGYIHFQSMSVYWWYAFILCGVVALLSGLAIQKEKRASNFYSVYSMPIDLKKFWIAKVAIVSAYVMISSLFAAWLTSAVSMLSPAYATLSLWKLLIGFCAIAVSVLWQVPLCMMLAYKLGIFAPVLLNTLLGIFSTLIAGESFWWISPYVWTAKLIEPLLGVKATGELASAALFDPAMIPAMLGATLTIGAVLLFISAHWFAHQEVK